MTVEGNERDHFSGQHCIEYVVCTDAGTSPRSSQAHMGKKQDPDSIAGRPGRKKNLGNTCMNSIWQPKRNETRPK